MVVYHLYSDGSLHGRLKAAGWAFLLVKCEPIGGVVCETIIAHDSGSVRASRASEAEWEAVKRGMVAVKAHVPPRSVVAVRCDATLKWSRLVSDHQLLFVRPEAGSRFHSRCHCESRRHMKSMARGASVKGAWVLD